MSDRNKVGKQSTDTKSVLAGDCGINWWEGGIYEMDVTSHEAELLCRYWAEQILRGYAEWASYHTNGIQHVRVDLYAWWRIAYFEQQMGKLEVQAILDNVFMGFEPSMKPFVDAIRSESTAGRSRSTTLTGEDDPDVKHIEITYVTDPEEISASEKVQTDG